MAADDELRAPLRAHAEVAPRAASAEEVRLHRRVTAFACAVIFFDAVEVGLILPSLFAYIQEAAGGRLSAAHASRTFGVALSVFSASSLVTQPLLGYIADRTSYRLMYAASIALAVLGNGVYACAGQCGALWMIVAGRAVAGVGCANTSITYAYVAAVLPREVCTRTMAVVQAFFSVGLILGPALNVLTAAARGSVLGLRLAPTNAPGLLVAALLVVLLGWVLLAFPEPPPPPRAAAAAARPARLGDVWRREWWRGLRAELSGSLAGVSLATGFAFMGTVSLMNNLCVAAASLAFALRPLHVSLLFVGSALEVLTLSHAAVVPLVRRGASDRALVLGGGACATLSLGYAALTWRYGMRLVHLAVGLALSCAAIPFVFAPNRARFAKAVEGSPNHALLQGVQGVASDLGAIAAPLYLAAFLGAPPAPGRGIATGATGGMAVLYAVLVAWDARATSGAPAAAAARARWSRAAEQDGADASEARGAAALTRPPPPTVPMQPTGSLGRGGRTPPSATA